MKPQLSEDQKKAITKRYENREDVASIAKDYGKSVRTIYYVLKRHRLTGGVERISRLDKKTRKRILKMVHKDPLIRTKKIIKRLKVQVSPSTINKFLRENAIVSDCRKQPLRLVD